MPAPTSPAPLHAAIDASFAAFRRMTERGAEQQTLPPPILHLLCGGQVATAVLELAIGSREDFLTMRMAIERLKPLGAWIVHHSAEYPEQKSLSALIAACAAPQLRFMRAQPYQQVGTQITWQDIAPFDGTMPSLDIATKLITPVSKSEANFTMRRKLETRARALAHKLVLSQHPA